MVLMARLYSCGMYNEYVVILIWGSLPCHCYNLAIDKSVMVCNLV